MDAEVQVGDVIQVWLDRAGYLGRIGRVERIVNGCHLLRLGDGEVVRLDIKNRKACIAGSTAYLPLGYSMVQKNSSEEKAQRSRFKRTTRFKRKSPV